MYLLHSVMSGILLFCYNRFFFSNNFYIIYEICMFQTIIYISQHVGYCEDAFILSSNYPKNLLLQLSRYGWIHHTTLQRSTLSKYFYHHPMSSGGHFPKASYADFTNNSILGKIFQRFFLSPLRAFFWSSANMAERHFWQIDIFLLKEFLVRIMIQLDAPYNTLEIHTLRIFLSSSHDLWREFP